MIASRKNYSPARWKAYSFARWLVLCVFLAAATFTVEALEIGSTLAKVHAPASTSELAAVERKAANSFFALFTHLKKPYYITNIYEKFDGAVISLHNDKTSNPAEDTYGFPFIHGAQHLVSKYQPSYQEYLEELTEILNEYEVELDANEITVQQVPEWVALQQQYSSSLIAWKNEDLDNPNRWIAGNVTFDKIREHFLTEQIAKAFFQKESSSCTICANIELAVSGTSGGLTSDMYFDFNVWDEVIDPIVYSTLDVLGSIPLVDFFADATGLIYSTIRGDGQSAAIYGLALSTPFIGAGGYKIIDKTIAYYARKNAQNIYEVAVKQWDDDVANWIRISESIPVDDNTLTSAKAFLNTKKGLLDEDIVEKIVKLRSISNLSSSLLTSSKISDDILSLGDDLQQVTSWINTSDNYFDVIIHGNSNGMFSVLLDGANHSFTSAQIANTLTAVPANKTLRLLSCNNAQSAQEIASILGRDVVGSTGEMKLFNNGYIEAQDWYIAKANGSLNSFTPSSSGLSPTGTWKVLKAFNGAGSVLGTIVKNGNKIEYTNPAGKLLKWTEQGVNDIDNAITTAKNLDPLNPNNTGRIAEGKVAYFLKQEGKQIEGFGLKIKDGSNNSDVGDIDVLTQYEIIEVKNSYSAWSNKPTEQLEKLLNTSNPKFFNPYSKKAILYIETPLTPTQRSQILSTIPNNSYLANSLIELKNLLK